MLVVDWLHVDERSGKDSILLQQISAKRSRFRPWGSSDNDCGDTSGSAEEGSIETA